MTEIDFFDYRAKAAGMRQLAEDFAASGVEQKWIGHALRLAEEADQNADLISQPYMAPVICQI